MLIEHLPVGSAYRISTIGPQASWTQSEYLLAIVADLLAAANWQRAGGKGQRPKRITRPGDKPRDTRYGTASIPIADMRRILDDWHQN